MNSKAIKNHVLEEYLVTQEVLHVKLSKFIGLNDIYRIWCHFVIKHTCTHTSAYFKIQ